MEAPAVLSGSDVQRPQEHATHRFGGAEAAPRRDASDALVGLLEQPAGDLDTGRLDGAEQEFRTSIELRPGRANPHNSLGVVLYREGRLTDAAREFAIAARLKPGFAMPINNLGVLQARLGRLEEARQSFEAALRLAPDYAEARENLARVRAQLGAR